MVVDVGLVEGTIPAITPTGTATSTTLVSLLVERMPTVFMSRMQA